MYIYLMSKMRLTLSLFCVVFFFGNQSFYTQNTTFEKQDNTLKQPPYLKAGDTVAIVAPSGILKNRIGEIQQAQVLLKSWGLHVVVGKHVFNQEQHFAGTDDERCEDFQNALDNSKISAIWCARGGYGAVRILDKLDWTQFKQKPKWIIGYSDITAIHSQTHNEGVESLHAMMCVDLAKDLTEIETTVSTFKNALFGNLSKHTLKGSSFNKTGNASGQLVGGNLTMLHTMLGSSTKINTSGKILFIEEIGEYKYHIDRMIQSLKRAGYFNECKGVIVGDMTKIKKNTTAWGTSIEQLVLNALSEFDFPIAFNMPAGHEKENRALIMGRMINLTVDFGKSTIIFKN